MSILFFDTETTGLPDFRASPEWERQPRVCQLAAVLTRDDGTIMSSLNTRIKPREWAIPDSAIAEHGITNEDALRFGIPGRVAFATFFEMVCDAKVVVAHNIAFDSFMIDVESARLPDRDFKPVWPERFCTMEACRPILQLPPTGRMLRAGIEGFKSPRLDEAYRYFFNKGLDGAHDAMVDVLACRDIYFALKGGDIYFARSVTDRIDLGATGKYPRGKYGDDDEGEIKIAIAADYEAGRLRIEFGKPVSSLGMTWLDGANLIETLERNVYALRHAEDVARGFPP